jgi:leishmanolysin
LEDGGGGGSAGAHFEKLSFGDDTMVSDDTMDAKYGPMTLAVGKDSGWYVVDMGNAEHFFWGKDEGCHIFENTCSTANVSEFCSSVYAQACSDNHRYITSCSNSSFTGSCNINLNIKSCKVAHTPNQHMYHYGTDAICLNSRVGFFLTKVNREFIPRICRML